MLTNMTSLRTVTERRNRALVVHVAEENQLAVDEVIVGDVRRLLAVQIEFRKFELRTPLPLLHPVGQPLLALLNHLLTERL